MKRSSGFLLFVILSLIAFSAWGGGGGGGGDPAVGIEGIIDLDESTFDTIVGKEKGALVEFYAPWCGHCKNLVPELVKLGKGLEFTKSDKAVFAKVNAEAHSSLASRFGVNGFPTIKYFPAGSQVGEDYNGGRSAADFAKYLQEKTGAQIQFPYEHSFVTVLNSNNFKSIALDPTKDVLVEFYAPWCGHCKALAPEYEKLAKVYNPDKDIVIAKLDATDGSNSNIAAEYGVTGYPTIKFFGKFSKQTPEEYDAGRDLNGFVNYINEHAKAFRQVDGDLSDLAGKDAELTKLVEEWKAASADERVAIQAKIGIRGKVLGHEGALYYAKVIEKIQKDAGFVKKELARLEKVLKGNLSAEKRDSAIIRKNVLSLFE